MLKYTHCVIAAIARPMTEISMGSMCMASSVATHRLSHGPASPVKGLAITKCYSFRRSAASCTRARMYAPRTRACRRMPAATRPAPAVVLKTSSRRPHHILDTSIYEEAACGWQAISGAFAVSDPRYRVLYVCASACCLVKIYRERQKDTRSTNGSRGWR